MLLTKFPLYLEEEGIVKFDGYVIDGASALWCAACAGIKNKISGVVSIVLLALIN